jgi:hypothetical protein
MGVGNEEFLGILSLVKGRSYLPLKEKKESRGNEMLNPEKMLSCFNI